MARIHLFVAAVVLAIAAALPVNMMMALDVIESGPNYVTQLRDENDTRNMFQNLKNAGFNGVMIDVWWGLTEPLERQYHFEGYAKFVELAADYGLKVQFVTSFHKCGGNINDAVTIPVPQFVRDVAYSRDAFYKDGFGNQDEEYLSLAASDEPIFNGRSAYTMYADWIDAMFNVMRPYILNGTLEELQVGSGPAGELRYPSYQLSRWQFPHPGAFQSYDTWMQNKLHQEFINAGRPDFKYSPGPNVTGGYNVEFEGSAFFRTNGIYASAYGELYGSILRNLLIAHGERMINIASDARTKAGFSDNQVHLAFKVAGIHWGYNHPSHGAELTAGYKNNNNTERSAYYQLAEMAQRTGAIFDFTCFEMRGTNNFGYSNPEQLVSQVLNENAEVGSPVAAENAITLRNMDDVNQVVRNIRQHPNTNFHAFTILRYNDYYPNGDRGLVENLVSQLNNM